MPALGVASEIHLELRNDRHNKAYNVYLEECPGGWRARSEYGAIGAPLKAGKGVEGVSFEAAQSKYDKLVAEKTGVPCSCCAGVYVPRSGEQQPLPEPVSRKKAAKAEPTPTVEAPPTFFPELLEPITPAEAGRYVVDPRWDMEEKLDGHRIAVWVNQTHMTAYNRLGEMIPVPGIELDRELRGKFNLLLDGEYVGGEYVAFDILRLDGLDLKDVPRRTRVRILQVTLADTGVRLAKTFSTAEEKEAELERLRAAGAEGAVFKDGLAGVMPGRQGINVKLKFWKNATVRVCAKKKEDGKSSFAVEALKGNVACVAAADASGERTPCVPCLKAGGCSGDDPHCSSCAADMEWVPVGTVTLTKSAMPAIGEFREVKYLYLGVGGRLYQPEDWGPRTDVTAADCAWSKLEHKNGGKK